LGYEQKGKTMFVAFVGLFCIMLIGSVMLWMVGSHFGSTVAFSVALMLAGVGYPTWREPGRSYLCEPLFWIGVAGMSLAIILSLSERIWQIRAELRFGNRFNRH
jgi:hypothetical protein